MLQVIQLTVKIGKKRLLNNISLGINPGELLAIVGPNGAGKSTLLKTLCGEITASSGSVWMNGKLLKQWRLSERARLCAVLPQHSSLSFPFSVMEVVLMGRSPYRKTELASHDYAIAAKAMELTGTEELCNRNYTSLSGGERQRVQFARVLAQIWEADTKLPRYLLLDEPTAALDLACQHACLSIACHLAKERDIAVLIILHDLNLAALYADRIAILQAGRLITVDTPAKVINSKMIKQIFNYPVSVFTHPQYKECPVVIPDIPDRQATRFFIK